jgi:TRAP-type C4-dicarboxylate transport system permease small subunit
LKTKRRGKGSLIFDGLLKALAAIAGVLLLVMVLIVSYTVVMRYFIGKPPVWGTEMTEWILLYATFLAAAWVLKDDGHVRIDVVLIRLSQKKQYILSVIVCILGILTCGFFAYHGAKAVYSLYKRDVIMMGMILMPKYILVAVIPLGILLSFVQFIRILKGLLAGKVSDGDAD